MCFHPHPGQLRTAGGRISLRLHPAARLREVEGPRQELTISLWYDSISGDSVSSSLLGELAQLLSVMMTETRSSTRVWFSASAPD